MKVVVAGSRSVTEYRIVEQAIKDSGFEITTLISGGARGVDKLGERYALERGIPIVRYIPDWSVGRHAGMVRNADMAKAADALVAIWDGKSRGTANMIENAHKHKLKVFVLNMGD